MFFLPISIATHTCVQGHPERMIKSMGLISYQELNILQMVNTFKNMEQIEQKFDD